MAALKGSSSSNCDDLESEIAGYFIVAQEMPSGRSLFLDMEFVECLWAVAEENVVGGL